MVSGVRARHDVGARSSFTIPQAIPEQGRPLGPSGFSPREGAPVVSSRSRRTVNNPHQGWRAENSSLIDGHPAPAPSSVIATLTTPQRLGAGFSAGFCSFRCMFVQIGAESENAKAKHVSTLHVHAFWCDCLARILSPVKQH